MRFILVRFAIGIASYKYNLFQGIPFETQIFGNLGNKQPITTGMNTKEPHSDTVEVGQNSYEMPPLEGISIAHFLTVADIDRSARWYEKVLDGRILSSGDSSGAPGYIQIANTWLLVNVGGGPTPDKPTVTLSVPDPDHINRFMIIRVADIQAC